MSRTSRQASSAPNARQRNSNDGSGRSRLGWIILALKVIIILLLISLLVLIIIRMVDIIKKQDTYKNKTDFGCDVTVQVISIVINLSLISLVATEQACWIIVAILFWIGDLAWEMVQYNKDGFKVFKAYFQSANFIITCVSIVLMLTFSILIFFK